LAREELLVHDRLRDDPVIVNDASEIAGGRSAFLRAIWADVVGEEHEGLTGTGRAQSGENSESTPARPRLGASERRLTSLDAIWVVGPAHGSAGILPRSCITVRTRSWASLYAASCVVTPQRRDASNTATAFARNFVEIIVKMSSGSTVNAEYRAPMEWAAATMPPALAMKSGMTAMPRLWSTSRAEGVVGKFAPSTISFAVVVRAMSSLMTSSRAAGTRTSVSTHNAASAGKVLPYSTTQSSRNCSRRRTSRSMSRPFGS